MSILRPTIVLLMLFTAITGVAYPLVVTGVARVIAPAQAGGSLVVRDGRVVGAANIGQSFTSQRYFHGRPSATTAPDPADPNKTIDAPYNAAASSGSNLGPSSASLKDAVAARIAGLGASPAPADLVTSSASGLDPHVSPDAALLQVPRIAAARGLEAPRVRSLVERYIEGRLGGVLGEPRVNVLALNLALDAMTR